jgi:hypothetical protein
MLDDVSASDHTITNNGTTIVPAPTYTLATAGAVTSINEGTALTFNITTTGIVSGTTLYWYCDGGAASTGHQYDGYTINANRFSPGQTGSFSITDNAGTFDITVSADSFTATGIQTYNITLSTVENDGSTFVGNTVSVTVNDTSQTPAPSFNQVIRLNPSYIPTNGGTSIPNEADSGSTSAAVTSTFTTSSAQGGYITLTGINSSILLPAKNVKTIGMWIKILPLVVFTRYLVDSRENSGPNEGIGTGYFYTGGVEGWTLLSINGNPADVSDWSTVANNTDTWQYVTVINQTNTPHSITLFNRFSLGESLANVQVGWIEAWDYIQADPQIATAYATHSSNYV